MRGIAPTSKASSTSSSRATSPSRRPSRAPPPAPTRSSTSPPRRTSTAPSWGRPSSSSPSCPYSASKSGGDLQVLAYVRTYGSDALVTRGANTYGPRQYPEKFLPLFITNAFDGKQLPVYGDGRQSREWLHVEDHCAAIEIALRRGGAGEVYNVGGQERENMEVVRRILDLTGGSPDLVRHVEDRPGHDRRYSVDSTKLQGLGWAPRHSFDAGGLAETV